jgi:stage V sporulation protein R
MFKNTNRNMIHHAAEHAARIEEYIDKYGFEKVEHLMDVGLALDGHIDWSRGLYREKYPGKFTRYKKYNAGEFDDVSISKRKPGSIKETANDKFPPHPEKDLLWFFINYAPLEEWEKDVLDIMREESFYFYPQMMTKISNEGFSVFWHAEIMYNYKNLSPEEYLDFLRCHEKVVQPSDNPFNMNPYYIGYRIFKDIEKRWDEKEGKGAGKKKVMEVMKEEDDISFLRNYLTADLVKELELFTYGYDSEYSDDWFGDKFIEVKEKIRDEVVEALIKPMYNGRVPKIVITGVGAENTLIMKHDSEELGTLDFKFAKQTLEYIWDLWAAPIELYVLNDKGEEYKLCYDECGFYTKRADEYFEEEEKEEDKKLRDTQKIFLPRRLIP